MRGIAPCRQRGVALLLLVTLLAAGASIGGLRLWQAPPQRIQADMQQQVLQRARQALLAYAVHYADLYGPTGAGPGHFPCPDTDVSSPWQRGSADGPNPPCADAVVSSGMLPARIVRDGRHYAFHQHTGQRLWYAVSGRFVNNPRDRIVNTTSVGSLDSGGRDDVIAVIAASGMSDIGGRVPPWQIDGARIRLLTQQVAGGAVLTTITLSDLQAPLRRRVLAWLLARLTTRHESRTRCSGTDNPEVMTSEQLLWQLVDEPVEGPVACEGPPPAQAVLEGVPLARHWFVRNRWLPLVDVSIDARCLTPSDNCRYTPQLDAAEHAAGDTSMPPCSPPVTSPCGDQAYIRLRLVPVSALPDRTRRSGQR